jgi:hypothetical protein
MDLAIQNTANTHWLADGGLSVDKPTFIRSSGSANKIINAIKASNALTIEAWVQPANTAQFGPARIVTLSVDHYNRNLTLGQNKSAYDVRLRTTSTDSNGMPSLASPAGTLGTALTHVVYTRDSAGTAHLYVNGVKQSQKTIAGNLSNWSGSYGFALANEFTGDRPWAGRYYQVAVYDHAISGADVNANYSNGPASGTSSGGNVGNGGSNTAPTISGTPPTQIVAGNLYSFKPIANDADNDPLTFSISTRPSWASFNSSTGVLSGTPTQNDIGSTANITLSVSDGTSTVSLPAFSLSVSGSVSSNAPKTGSVNLSWTAPVARTDGSLLAMSEITGYTVYYGTSKGNYPDSLSINNRSATSATISNLPVGTYYLVVTIRDTGGRESGYSSMVTKWVQ